MDKRELRLVGKVFNRLTVLKFDKWVKTNRRNGKERLSYWLCQCSCGKVVSKAGLSITSGYTQSCGCLAIEVRKNNLIYGAARTAKTKYDSTERNLYNKYIRRANTRNIEFNLSLEQFKELTKQNCYLCGKEPSQIFRKQEKLKNLTSDYIYNGIDRLDNKKGYFFDNCQGCCFPCNRMKSTYNYEDFIIYINKLLERYYDGKN